MRRVLKIKQATPPPRQQKVDFLACARSRRHPVRWFNGTGGASWRQTFTQEFKLETVRLIKERGVSFAQASQDLGVHVSQLRSWGDGLCG